VLSGIVQAAGELVQEGHDLGQARPLAAQFLGAFRLVPDLGILKLAVYFLEAFAL
jgi:hypothetical protein